MKVAVIGAGASGLMASVLSSEKHDITLFEKQSKPGKKIIASGNGKCNISLTTNMDSLIQTQELIINGEVKNHNNSNIYSDISLVIKNGETIIISKEFINQTEFSFNYQTSTLDEVGSWDIIINSTTETKMKSLFK